ncbi:MAG: GspE/PulE family protein [Candidatus Nomurabacteria bacterium]|nr:GspE/PulE family protein [Candidatus Nomurabacteria bacterium]
MKLDDAQIQKILVDKGYTSSEDISAYKNQEQRFPSFLDFALSKQIITQDLFGQALAEHYNIKYTDLNSHPPTDEILSLVPQEIAHKNRIVAVSATDSLITLATDIPDQEKIAEILSQVFPGKQTVLTFSTPRDINDVLARYQQPLETRFSEIIKNNKRIAPEILQEIFDDAITYQSSDIHFEPQKTDVVVRFRVDGVMREAGRIPQEYYENILNRVKVQASLRIDEHFSAQDGSLQHSYNDEEIDMRISIVPTVYGEKIVLRILRSYVGSLSLENLGLSENHRNKIETHARKPFGMILVVGPTGSGKTTTLYALLKTLNTPLVNITTIEDPVEYKIPGINQIQVNNETELSFAKGLRSIVRQDPDIILVGEIRDKETAEIAVNAALTGHLVLSTFHANDVATAIPRLLDMGIEPFLLASTLELVIGQRLVRTLDESCRQSVSVNHTELAQQYPDAAPFFAGEKHTLYNGGGCNPGKEFKGRTSIFEFIENSKEMKKLIMESPSAQQVWELASKHGSKTLFQDGIERVKQGITTLDELLRVATPSEFETPEMAKTSDVPKPPYDISKKNTT